MRARDTLTLSFSSAIECMLPHELPWRREKITVRPRRAAESSIQRCKGAIERLGHRDIPGIVAAQIAAQLPNTAGKRRKGKQVQIQPQQVPVRAGCLQSGNFPGLLQTAQYVGHFNQHQFGTRQRTFGDRRLRPFALWPRIHQRRYEYGRIDDQRHFRSVSRARRMLAGGTRVPATSFRSRTLLSHSDGEGRDTIRSNSQRRNSCMDWRCSAARAARRSRTASGTPRIVS